MAAIRQRGRLIAGVSADTFLLGARNPVTGDVEGFDIDLVKQIAKAIFGDENRYQLRVITAAQRLEVLQNHEVDVVARNMTITCDRWKSIAFSAEYYLAGQKILVRKGSDITGLDSLAGHRVCAPLGTSSMDNLIRLAPDAEPVGADNHTGCLVLLQEGQVDAITGDDTVLAGLASQDPYAVVLDEAAFTEEPYGIGVPADQVDMVRFVNGVLERMRADGSWEAGYEKWLQPTLGKSSGQPQTPQYGRTPLDESGARAGGAREAGEAGRGDGHAGLPHRARLVGALPQGRARRAGRRRALLAAQGRAHRRHDAVDGAVEGRRRPAAAAARGLGRRSRAGGRARAARDADPRPPRRHPRPGRARQERARSPGTTSGALAVSLPEACRLSDALAGQLRQRLSLDPAADANAARVKDLRAALDRLRDQVALEPDSSRPRAQQHLGRPGRPHQGRHRAPAARRRRRRAARPARERHRAASSAT